MTEDRTVLTQSYLLWTAVTLMAASVVLNFTAACSPEAGQIAAPLVAASPAACALLAEGSAERQVCDASADLARALERLAAERRARAAGSSSAIESAPSAAPAPAEAESARPAASH